MRIEVKEEAATTDDVIGAIIRHGGRLQAHSACSEIPRCEHNLAMIVIVTSATHRRKQRTPHQIIDVLQ